MTSQTKATILEQHRANGYLNTSVPAPMVQNAHDLSAEEALFPVDEQIIAASSGAMEEGHTHYVPVPGIEPLREALASYLDGGYEPGNVLVTAGMQEARFLTTQLIGGQFGHIGVPSVVHPGVGKALGVRPMTVNAIASDSTRYLPTVDAVRETLEGGSKLVYLESPSRLTGAAYTEDEVAALANLLTEHEAAVIWDQGFAPWGEAVPSIAGQTDRVAVIGEAFPGMGLASWYIGYIAAPEDWIAPMQSQKQIMAICTSTASQYAALEASKLYKEAHSISALQEQRTALADLAVQSGLTVIGSDVANVIAVEMPSGKVQKLADAGYTVADGGDFGAPGVFRLLVSAAAQDALKQLI